MSSKKLLAALISLSLISTATPSAEAKEYPKRIVSLSPSATEIFFAIGAGKQIVAADSYSNYPSTAPKTDLSAFDPNVEAIASYKPDLVLLSADSTKSTEVAAALEKLGIKVIMEKAPTNIQGVYNEIGQLATATNHRTKAKKLVQKMQDQISKVIRKYRSPDVRIFHELDNTYYTATSKTFIGGIYKSFGVTNIADAAAGADKSGYPQLTAEYLVKSDPQVIFLADAQYGEGAAMVKSRAGWSEISAVKNNHIIELPADIPSRWGPRIVNFYQLVGKALAGVK
jgi:iron complex transport system substrate-binding protein